MKAVLLLSALVLVMVIGSEAGRYYKRCQRLCGWWKPSSFNCNGCCVAFGHFGGRCTSYGHCHCYARKFHFGEYMNGYIGDDDGVYPDGGYPGGGYTDGGYPNGRYPGGGYPGGGYPGGGYTVGGSDYDSGSMSVAYRYGYDGPGSGSVYDGSGYPTGYGGHRLKTY